MRLQFFRLDFLNQIADVHWKLVWRRFWVNVSVVAPDGSVVPFQMIAIRHHPLGCAWDSWDAAHGFVGGLTCTLFPFGLPPSFPFLRAAAALALDLDEPPLRANSVTVIGFMCVVGFYPNLLGSVQNFLQLFSSPLLPPPSTHPLPAGSWRACRRRDGPTARPCDKRFRRLVRPGSSRAPNYQPQHHPDVRAEPKPEQDDDGAWWFHIPSFALS